MSCNSVPHKVDLFPQVHIVPVEEEDLVDEEAIAFLPRQEQGSSYLHRWGSLLHEWEIECVLGVPVPYKRDRSLITWDRSQNVECFGTGPITLFIEQFLEEIIYFGLILCILGFRMC